MSLPSVLAPAEINNRAYIDGGLVRNLPIDVGRELCGDVIIAVNLGTKPKTSDQVRSSLDVALQSIVILTEQNVHRSLQELTAQDVLIEPEAGDFTSSSFANQREIISHGRTAAMMLQTELSVLSVSPDEYQSWLQNRKSMIPSPIKVTAITAKVSGSVNQEALQRDIDIQPAEDFDTNKLDEEITTIYGRGDFSYVGYATVPEDDAATVVIEAKTKPWGPGYLKFGMGTIMDFSSPTQFNLAASYRRTWVNALGAEWRSNIQIGYDTILKTEFIQPLQVRDGAFLDPYIMARRNFIQLYNYDVRLGDFEIERYEAGLDAGITGRIGELRIGTFASNVITRPGLGAIDPLFTDTDATQKGLQIRAIIDQLDSYRFPTSGLFLLAEIRKVNQQNDTPHDYTRGLLELKAATSFGSNTLAGKFEWGDELSGENDLPVFEAFQLGGPNRLSGLFLDQLTGTRYQLATLNYYYRYAGLPPQVGRGAYLGFSVEGGRINDPLMQDPWDATYSASIYWGADTVLGAVYLGYGYSSLKEKALYLMIGPRL
jgi:NTE family protein